MRRGTQLPWVTALLASALVLNPLGIDVLKTAFFSSDPLSRAIWRPIVLIGMAILATIALVEWLARTSIQRRRASGATNS